MTEEGPKAKPEHIPLLNDVMALQPQRQLESRFSSEHCWMECWLWVAVTVWDAMVVSAAVVLWLVCCCSTWKNTKPNTARKPPHFLLRIEKVLLAVFFADVS